VNLIKLHFIEKNESKYLCEPKYEIIVLYNLKRFFNNISKEFNYNNIFKKYIKLEMINYNNSYMNFLKIIYKLKGIINYI
jgi:SNF2 family DNA or RNA helicase